MRDLVESILVILKRKSHFNSGSKWNYQITKMGIPITEIIIVVIFTAVK